MYFPSPPRGSCLRWRRPAGGRRSNPPGKLEPPPSKRREMSSRLRSRRSPIGRGIVIRPAVALDTTRGVQLLVGVSLDHVVRRQFTRRGRIESPQPCFKLGLLLALLLPARHVFGVRRRVIAEPALAPNDSNYYGLPSAEWAVWRSRACHGRASREMGCVMSCKARGRNRGGRELQGMPARLRQTVDLRIAGGRTD